MSSLPSYAFCIAARLAILAFICACQPMSNSLSDLAGDDRVFAGDPEAFLGKETILQFRWGEPDMYGSAIRCIPIEVEADALVVRGLQMNEGSYPALYAKLVSLEKLTLVGSTKDIFRVPREDIHALFLPSTTTPGS